MKTTVSCKQMGVNGDSDGCRHPCARWECVSMERNNIIGAEVVLINKLRQQAAVLGDQLLCISQLSGYCLWPSQVAEHKMSTLSLLQFCKTAL